MKKVLLLSVFLLIYSLLSAQTTERIRLRGKVLYKNTNVANENVINVSSDKATITNKDGEFEILVKLGDELAFSAVNYKLKTVKITEAILKRKRLIVEVNEKITELDEVIITPENREKFMEIKQEEFKKFYYERDASTQIENSALSQGERGMTNGINFVNIFKAIFASEKNKKPAKSQIKPSMVLRQVYEDAFFVIDLKIPQDKIDAFLYYCDAKLSTQALLKKENEFQLIEFLVNQSNAFRKTLE